MSHPDPGYADRPVHVHAAAATSDPIKLVKQALGIYIARINSALINRRDHPTYGYTKADIRSDLDKAEAMLAMLAVLQGDSMNVIDFYVSDKVKERYPQHAELRYLRRWVNSKSVQAPEENA